MYEWFLLHFCWLSLYFHCCCVFVLQLSSLMSLMTYLYLNLLPSSLMPLHTRTQETALWVCYRRGRPHQGFVLSTCVSRWCGCCCCGGWGSGRSLAPSSELVALASSSWTVSGGRRDLCWRDSRCGGSTWGPHQDLQSSVPVGVVTAVPGLWHRWRGSGRGWLVWRGYGTAP